MIKRIVVAGSRGFTDYEQAKAFIDLCIRDIREKYTPVFVSGGCRGADLLGERYAKENGFAIERYPAQWEKYGKGAGLKRNRQMAQLCDCLICFWDGKSKGTKAIIAYAEELNKPVMIKRF